VLKKIMVAVDGSSFSEHAVDYARGIAERSGAELHLTLVHEPMPTWAAAPSGGTLEEQAREGEEAYLTSLIETTKGKTTAPVTGDLIGAPGSSAFEEHAVKRGFTDSLLNRPVAAALAMHSQARRVDLVVLSTHGRGAIRRLWLGSVAEQLVWQVDLPSLLIKPREEGSDAWDGAFDHILLPLDTSPASEAVVETTLEVATLFGAKVTVLQVIGGPLPYSGIPPQLSPEAVANLVDEQVAAARPYLEGIVSRFTDAGLEADADTISSESPTAGILQVAEDRGADLIAMSSHGGGVKSVLMGSVTSRVVQRAGVPILVATPPRKK
jgi:nucleotide-binding universal stress UspA family protein